MLPAENSAPCAAASCVTDQSNAGVAVFAEAGADKVGLLGRGGCSALLCDKSSLLQFAVT